MQPSAGQGQALQHTHALLTFLAGVPRFGACRRRRTWHSSPEGDDSRDRKLSWKLSTALARRPTITPLSWGVSTSARTSLCGSRYGSGSGGRHRGGVGSGMGRQRPLRLATAAAAGTGSSRQLVRYVWHVGWSSQGTTAAQAVPCQTSTDDPHKHSLKRARMAWLSLASCLE